MKLFFLCLVSLLLSVTHLSAQPAVPAQPADPNQARPAMPVVPDSATPPPTAKPVVPTVDLTNAPAANAPQVAVSIIADSSLKAVLQELAQAWADTQDTGPQIPLALTNASTLRAKVEANPAYDVVISADVADVKAMTDKGVLSAEGQHSLARNSLVIYGRKALVKDDDLEWFDLIGSEWKKVAVGSPDAVASGRVAQHALQKHDLLGDDNKNTFVYAHTDAMAMGVVLRDQADAIFVFKTDAALMNLHGFEIVPIKSEDAPPVFYTAAVGRLAKNPTMARAFIDYCSSADAKAIWAKYGFETN